MVGFVLALMLAAPSATTTDESWASGGYQQFRWGMGPGDVERSLSRGPLTGTNFKREWTYGEGDRLGCYSAQTTWAVGGAEASEITFFFKKNRLAVVQLSWTPDNGVPQTWRRAVEKALIDKYGQPPYRRTNRYGGVTQEWPRIAEQVSLKFEGHRGVALT